MAVSMRLLSVIFSPPLMFGSAWFSFIVFSLLSAPPLTVPIRFWHQREWNANIHWLPISVVGGPKKKYAKMQDPMVLNNNNNNYSYTTWGAHTYTDSMCPPCTHLHKHTHTAHHTHALTVYTHTVNTVCACICECACVCVYECSIWFIRTAQ